MKIRPFILLAVALLGLVITHGFYNYIWGIKFPEPIGITTPTYAFSEVLLALLISKPTFIFCTMVLGILFGRASEEASRAYSSGTQIISKDVLKRIALGTRSLAAIAASPLVFAITYVAVKEVPDNFAAFFFAFQNGFFWDTVLNKFRRKSDEKGNGT